VSNGVDHGVEDEVERVSSSKQSVEMLMDHSVVNSGRKTVSKAETIEEQLVTLDDVKCM